jgi:hypothetical protein
MSTTRQTRYRRRPARDPIRVLRARCRRKFLAYFPDGFEDADYLGTERGYKVAAHERWTEELGRDEHRRLIDEGRFTEFAERAVKIEGRTHLLFSFEKMALRDAVRSRAGAERFAVGLYERLYGRASPERRFDGFTETLEGLPRRQSRVLTWPVHTVWGFLAQPERHFYLKPRVMQRAAEAYGFDFVYRSRPNWETYSSALAFAEQVREDTADLGPRDLIDLQSFLWVMGSDEYPD